MKLLVCLVVLAPLVAAATQQTMGGPDFKEFMAFMTTYNKVYDSPAELRQRFANFQANLRDIEALNAQNSLATYGITQFSDMSRDEFLQSLGMTEVHLLQGPELRHARAPENRLYNNPSPNGWDWRDHGRVTHVKNQGSCGSCWAFSAIGAAEGQAASAGNGEVLLSEQQFVDCDKHSGGCGGGWPHWAYQSVLDNTNGGIDSDGQYPYHARGGQCAYVDDGHPYSMDSYTVHCAHTPQLPDPTKPCDPKEMTDLLQSFGPLSVCLDATMLMSYHTGIVDGSSCRSEYQNHCVLAVGYGEESGTDFWIVKNSWGTSWGEQGYFRIKRGSDTCNIESTVFTPHTA